MPEDKAAARGWRVVVVYTFVFATNLYTNQNKPLPAFFNSMWEKDEIPGVTKQVLLNKGMLMIYNSDKKC